MIPAIPWPIILLMFGLAYFVDFCRMLAEWFASPLNRSQSCR